MTRHKQPTISVRISHEASSGAVLVLGGHTVAHFAQKLPHQLVRGLIIFAGFGMTAYFLLKACR
jgi:hypothetical protein